MLARLYVTDELGHVTDVFQLDRYDLHSASGQEILAQDIQDAQARRPSDFTVRPDIANELIALLDNALSTINNNGHHEHQVIARLAIMLRRLRNLNCYMAIDPDQQRQQLIDEMTLTALLYEQIEKLIDLCQAAFIRSQENRLSYTEFDDLGTGLLDLERALEAYPARVV